MIPVDGLSDRIHTPEAQALVTKLRTSAVTVLGNYFQILPLTATKGEIAVLTVGDEGSDASFIEGLRSELPLKTFRMDKNTGEEERRKIVKELGNYRRVVVSITVQDKEAGEYRSFFAGFRPQAPVVYAFFTTLCSRCDIGQSFGNGTFIHAYRQYICSRFRCRCDIR